MKQSLRFLILLPSLFLLSGCGADYQGPRFITWLLAIPGVLLIALSALRMRSIWLYNRRNPHRKLPVTHHQLTAAVCLAGLILLVLAFITMYLR